MNFDRIADFLLITICKTYSSIKCNKMLQDIYLCNNKLTLSLLLWLDFICQPNFDTSALQQLFLIQDLVSSVMPETWS